MATKTIVRWKPPTELYDRREITLRDLEGVGIFTQKQGPLVWERSRGYWVDADELPIASEVMDRLESPEFSNDGLGWFTIEKQEVEDSPAIEGASDESATEAEPTDSGTTTSEGLPPSTSRSTRKS